MENTDLNIENKRKVGRPRKYEDGLARDYKNQSNYNANYYQKNKEKQRQKYLDNNVKVTCECGRVVSKLKLASHLQTNLHKRFLEKKNATICVECN
tara:strand:+ start:177 stop:464 length:288 start_codon:yes stop_codon:yes gene_type:complete